MSMFRFSLLMLWLATCVLIFISTFVGAIDLTLHGKNGFDGFTITVMVLCVSGIIVPVWIVRILNRRQQT